MCCLINWEKFRGRRRSVLHLHKLTTLLCFRSHWLNFVLTCLANRGISSIWMNKWNEFINEIFFFLFHLLIAVINELEGLSRGNKLTGGTSSAMLTSPLAPTLTIFTLSTPKYGNQHDPEHAQKVAEACKLALTFLKSKNPSVKWVSFSPMTWKGFGDVCTNDLVLFYFLPFPSRCVTTKGSVLTSSIFTVEDDTDEQKSNDNKILDTVSSLCKNNVEETRGKWIFDMSHRHHTRNFSHFFTFPPLCRWYSFHISWGCSSDERSQFAC